MTSRTSALIATAILELVVIFQIALILGAPLGEYTQGGQTIGALGTTQRLIAGGSIVLLTVMIAGLSAYCGLGPLRKLQTKTIRRLIQFTFGYAVLGTVLNAVSQSPKERLWAVVTLSVALLTWNTLKK
jgi:hypothetical protein